MLEKTLDSPLDCKEIQPINPKGNQFWIFIGSTDAEAPIFWPLDARNWFVGKDPDAGKDWGQEEKVATEDELVGWHHRLNWLESEQTLEDSEGQGSLECCGPWSHKDLDTTKQLNNNNNLCVCVCVCVCIHIYIKCFALHLKLTQHCKSTILQFFKNDVNF